MWTEALLRELAEAITAGGRRPAATAAAICDGVRRTFPEGEVRRADYEHLVDEVPGPDPDDREHPAAAIAAGCDLLLTNDKKGFPVAALGRRGLRVRRPDDYLVELLDAYPDDVVGIVEEMARDKIRPPMTTGDVLDALQRAGVADFARRVRRLL